MFEQVYNGDFNWVTPHFIALASPQDEIQRPIARADPKYATIPHTADEIQQCADLPDAFKTVLTYFTHRNVGLVVRLNDPLYSPTFFTANGIQHVDMIFDDGTCPTLPVVRRFIRMAHEMITVKKKAIGVHCKAGLGRTGCLIGAYLIYRHGFTANEVIAYMRFMRPGMVVGPQQHWLHLNQNAFREWWFEDSMKARLAAQVPSTPPKMRAARAASAQATPPTGRSRAALEEINSNEQSPTVAEKDDCCAPAADDNMLLPAPTPGQPRKTSRSYGGRRSTARGENAEPFILADADVAATERRERKRKQRGATAAGAVAEDSEDELQVRMLLRRASASRSPAASPGSVVAVSVSREHRRRVVSCTSAAAATGVRKASARVGSLGNASAIKAK
jgi:cell division cycle 14